MSRVIVANLGDAKDVKISLLTRDDEGQFVDGGEVIVAIGEAKEIIIEVGEVFQITTIDNDGEGE